MRYPMLVLAGLALGACESYSIPGMSASAPASVDPAREAQFVALLGATGCELHQSDNDALLGPAGFSDAEASAISQQLIADGRAEVNAEGNLVLTTGNCV